MKGMVITLQTGTLGMFTILSNRNKNRKSLRIFNSCLKRKKSANIFENIANIPENSGKEYATIKNDLKIFCKCFVPPFLFRLLLFF